MSDSRSTAPEDGVGGKSMLKLIYQELVAIKKELQAIRSSLECTEQTITVKPTSEKIGIRQNFQE